MAEPTLTHSHVGICVSDLTRSLRFYCDGLGFTVAEGYDLDDTLLPGLANALEVESPVAIRSQMITLGDTKIELLAYANPAVTGSPSTSRGQLGLTHLAFRVDELDATAAHLVACGGTLLPDAAASVGVRLQFLTDPDGTRVELIEM